MIDAPSPPSRKASELSPRLHEALATQRIIPIVGAGIARTVTTPKGTRVIPNWHRVLECAADCLDRHGGNSTEIRSLITGPSPDYSLAIERANHALGPGRWSKLMRDCFDPDRESIRDVSLGLSRAIWRLGSKLILTTNYDRVLRWACPRVDDLDEVSIESRSRLDKINDLEHPLVWHLYGRIRNDAELRLPGSPTTLPQFVVGRRFLFLGYDTDDEVVMQQLTMLLTTVGEGDHYVVARARDMDRLARATNGANVEFLEFDDYGSSLAAVLERLARAAGVHRWDVYMSYAKPDREQAERIASELDRLGVKVFIDAWEILPGDITEKQRDLGLRESKHGIHIVSRWSQGMSDEVAALLDRAARDEQSKVIPVLLDDTELPAKLRIREAVDLRQGDRNNAIASLFRAIRDERGKPGDS